MVATDQPWSPAQATDLVRRISGDPKGDTTWTRHALERLRERGLTTSDALWVLRRGFVHEPPAEESTVKGLYKYVIEGRAPNSGRRTVRIVAVPDANANHVKIMTVMWKDGS